MKIGRKNLERKQREKNKIKERDRKI